MKTSSPLSLKRVVMGGLQNPEPAPLPSQNAVSRVLLVDDHPIVRQGLTELINRQKGMMVCGEAGSAPEAMEKAASLAPDLAIVDVTLQEKSGLELIKDLKIQYPRLPVLVLSMHDETLYAERTLRAGARGYVMKQEASDRIALAIRFVLTGEIYLSDRMKSRILRNLVEGETDRDRFSISRLSDRELEVFRLLGEGFSTRQVAARLNLSVKTIESYRESLKQKMDLKTGAELVQQAIKWARTETPGL